MVGFVLLFFHVAVSVPVPVFVNWIVPGVGCGSGRTSPLAPKIPVTIMNREKIQRMKGKIRGTRGIIDWFILLFS